MTRVMYNKSVNYICAGDSKSASHISLSFLTYCEVFYQKNEIFINYTEIRPLCTCSISYLYWCIFLKKKWKF